ncbi:MAG: serine/threonine protein kinase, partial [Candidatus Eisenbacteria bacterium]|nr:serine/threonine protein kinase [Candidatus Eisenbacteria bacterium]
MDPAADIPGDLAIAGYRIHDQIGSGGMSAVYRGTQTSLDRTVAIKFLSHEFLGDSGIRERFERESVIIARLNHPGIVRVIDRGVTRDGRPYFVMEHVEGADLASLIDRGTLETSQKLDIVVQVCKALAYAHHNGVIHGDIKPANVILDRDGHARILDFGIARVARGDHPGAPASELVVGTPSYMSPEQVSGTRPMTARSDLYSLGVLIYELFTGRKPPTGRFTPPSQIDRRIPAALDRIVERCLQVEPAHRFSSADEVKDRILSVMPGAHLETVQRERTRQDLGAVDGKFTLL